MLALRASERALPFYIDEERPRKQRFNIEYRGKTYYIAESLNPCPTQDAIKSSSPNDACQRSFDDLPSGYDRRDETLFILSILNQLLDLYKNGSDIPITPAVQAVP